MTDTKISEARNLLAEAFGCDPEELLDGEVRAVRAVLALQSVRPQPAELAEQQGVTDAMVDAALSRWFNTEETSHCADIPEYKSDMRNSLTAAIAAAQGIDLVPLRRLYQAYVRLLESGRDRIIDLGGTCDPVEVMERMDINLIEARNLLGIKIDQRDAGTGVGNG